MRLIGCSRPCAWGWDANGAPNRGRASWLIMRNPGSWITDSSQDRAALPCPARRVAFGESIKRAPSADAVKSPQSADDAGYDLLVNIRTQANV